MARGYHIYFSDSEEDAFLFPYKEYNDFTHTNKFDCLNFICNDNDIKDVNFVLNNNDYAWSNKVPECTPYNFDLNNKKIYTYSGYICSIINPPNQTNYAHKIDINNTQYINQNLHPYNKYNENYINNINVKCGSIVRKFYNSKYRDEITKKYPKIDGLHKIKPTQIGPVAVTGRNPTPIGKITTDDTTNYATEQKTGYICSTINLPNQLITHIK